MRTTITIEVQKSRLLKPKDCKTNGPLRYDNRFIGRVRKVRGAANADNDNYRSPKIAAPQSLSLAVIPQHLHSQQIINHEGAT